MSTDISLNPAGQGILTTVTSAVVNGVSHPLCTIKNCLMTHTSIPWGTKLYRGFGAVTALDAAVFCVAKGVNDQSKKILSPASSALLAGAISTPIVAAGEALMTNCQVHGISYRDALGKVLNLRGLVTTAGREMGYNQALFVLGPKISEKFDERGGKMGSLLGGTVAGVWAGFLTTPIDRVKTVIQTSDNNPTISSVVKEIVKQEGLRGLFKGGAMRSGYLGIAIALQSLLYSALPKKMPDALREKTE